MKRKERMNYTNEQKLEYARMMVENNYLNQQIKDIWVFCVSCWSRTQ